MTAGLTAALLGRGNERAVVAGALAGASAGSGALLLVSGEPGIGRTALAAEAADAAAARAMRVAWGRCWDSDDAPPLWPWIQVLRALRDDRASLGAWVSAAATADRLLAALREASRDRPVLVVLDDLHVAGAASSRVLRLVAQALPTLPVAVIATFSGSLSRTTEGARAMLAELASTHPHLALRGLSQEDVGNLLADLGHEPTPDLAQRVHAASAGNPLLVTLLARTAPSPGTWEEHPEDPPEELRAHVRHQLQALPEATRSLLDIVAIQPRCASVEVVARTAGLGAPEVRHHLGPALEEGVLEEVDGRLAFRHGIVRGTRYADLPPADRAALHRRAASALEGTDRDPEVRAEAAHHEFHADMGGGGRGMLTSLVSAARDAVRAGAATEAVPLLRHAVDCAEGAGATAEERGHLLADLAGAQRSAGAPEAAERSWQAALALARLSRSAPLLARTAVGTARTALYLGLATPEHVHALEEALEALGPEPTAECAIVLAHLGAALHWTRERDRGIALTERALEVARGTGDPRALAAALLSRYYVARGTEDAGARTRLATEAVRAAEAAGDLDAAVLARSALVVDHRERGDAGAADAAIGDLRDFAAARVHGTGRWAADVHALVSALLADDRAAVAALTDAVDRSVQGARDRRYLTEFAVVMTDLDPIGAEVRARVQRRARQLPEVVSWRARALLDAVERGEEAVDPELGAILALLRAPGRADAHWLLAAALTAEAVAVLGDARRARGLQELLEPHAGALVVAGRLGASRGTVRYHLGLLSMTTGDAASAVGHLEAAVDVHLLSGHAAHLPRTREALARAEEALGAVRSDLGTLVRAGAFWSLEGASRGTLLPDAKGLRYLAHLLGSPGREVRALDLYRLDASGGAADAGGAAELGGGRELARDGGGADPVLDAIAKRAYRARMEALDAEISEAGARGDDDLLAELAAERAAFEAALAGGVGRGGRDRRLPSEAERARTSVTKALRGAVERLRAVDPEVGEHLDGSVRTGARCSYSPQGRRLRVRP